MRKTAFLGSITPHSRQHLLAESTKSLHAFESEKLFLRQRGTIPVIPNNPTKTKVSIRAQPPAAEREQIFRSAALGHIAKCRTGFRAQATAGDAG
jgi:hypothetical protein